MTVQNLTLDVLKVRQKIGDFFIASISAKDLVDISYSDVRRLAKDQRDIEKYLGIQRPVSPKRIKEIKKYIESNDATFPTSVILAVDTHCAEYHATSDKAGKLVLKAYQPEPGSEDMPISFDKIAKVIDGQHRIAAFMDENKNWCFDFSEPFEINVSIFIGADISEQANIFATVNLAQTKVNKSLVYDLTELADTRSPYKTCHNIAVMLDKQDSSPLYRRIKRLGTATPGRRKEPLTQASFVESLVKFISFDPDHDRNELFNRKRLKPVSGQDLINRPFRNLFIEDRELDIAEILYNYFSAVEQKWPESWAATDRVGNLLPRSNAFKALMIYLREDAYIALARNEIGRIPSTKEFSKCFDHIELTDEDFTIKNFAPGSGGQSTFLKMLRGQIGLEDMLED